MTRTKFGLMISVSVVSACSILLKTDRDQCATDDDCRRRGGEFANAQCVASVCAQLDAEASTPGPVDPSLGCIADHPAPKPSTASAKLNLFLHDFSSTSKPVTSVNIRLCPNSADPQCVVPAATKQPDATGHVTFDLDLSQGPFTGYLATDPIPPDGGGADAGDTSNDDAYMPIRLFYTGVPVAADLTDDWTLLTYGAQRVFVALYGLRPPDPNLGLAIVNAVDCQRGPLGDISTVVDSTVSSSASFYLRNGFPTTTASSADSTGVAGFWNVPTGARTFSARFASTQRALGSVTMYVYAGTVSVAAVGPAFTR